MAPCIHLQAMDHEITHVTEQPLYPLFSERVRPGAVLGNYRLKQRLGSGFMSEVYHGQNLVTQKSAVVKIFSPALRLNHVRFGRYVHEAKQISLLNHPQIADVYNFESSEGLYYAVMELVEGVTLNALMRKNAPLQRSVILTIVQGICAALAEVHTHGLTHQHLHGNQVIVMWEGKEPTVKLLDFGLHHVLPDFKDEIPNLSRLPEHAICISPEQAKGQAGDVRSDIYAVCVLLYEMATAKVPFLGETFASTLEQHLSENPLAPGKVAPMSPELERTILRGLEKDPRQRIPSVEALVAALDPLAVTGQFQALTRGGSVANRSGGLISTPSREYELKAFGTDAISSPGNRLPSDGSTSTQDVYFSLPSKGQVSIRPQLERFSAPKSRRWLFIFLGIMMVICALALVYFFRSDENEKSFSPKPPSKTSINRTTPANTPRP